jgi:RNA polymerase sigma-70 factor (ECF subfamily)
MTTYENKIHWPRLGAWTQAAERADPDGDEVLAERVRATGDSAAFAVLVTRYRGRVIALARRLLPAEPGEAEDIAQETFLAVYDKRAGFRRGQTFRPWLYRIAVNRCLDRLRARQRRPPPLDLDHAPEVPEEDSDPLDALLADEREAHLAEAVAALPPHYRAIFLLRHLDDLSYEEIAQAMTLPLGTVKTYLFRARAQLRLALTGYLREP